MLQTACDNFCFRRIAACFTWFSTNRCHRAGLFMSGIAGTTTNVLVMKMMLRSGRSSRIFSLRCEADDYVEDVKEKLSTYPGVGAYTLLRSLHVTIDNPVRLQHLRSCSLRLLAGFFRSDPFAFMLELTCSFAEPSHSPGVQHTETVYVDPSGGFCHGPSLQTFGHTHSTQPPAPPRILGILVEEMFPGIHPRLV